MFNNNKSVTSKENLSAMYDGDRFACNEISDDAKKHMQNWSLIGSAMRNELPKKIDIDFANKIASKLNLDAPRVEIQEDQDTVKQDKAYSLIAKYTKRTMMLVSQIAVAASVTISCIVGYQTYLASNVTEEYNSVLTSNKSVGEVSGLSLVSYQNQNYTAPMRIVDSNSNISTINEYKKKELDHIHQLVNGYIYSDSSRR